MNYASKCKTKHSKLYIKSHEKLLYENCICNIREKPSHIRIVLRECVVNIQIQIIQSLACLFYTRPPCDSFNDNCRLILKTLICDIHVTFFVNICLVLDCLMFMYSAIHGTTTYG